MGIENRKDWQDCPEIFYLLIWTTKCVTSVFQFVPSHLDVMKVVTVPPGIRDYLTYKFGWLLSSTTEPAIPPREERAQNNPSLEGSLDGEGAELEDDTPPGDGQDAGDQSGAYGGVSDSREVIFERYVEGQRRRVQRGSATHASSTGPSQMPNQGSNSNPQLNVQSFPRGVIPQLFPTAPQGNSQGFPQGLSQGIATAPHGNFQGFPHGIPQGFPTGYQSQTLIETGQEQIRSSSWLQDDLDSTSQGVQVTLPPIPPQTSNPEPSWSRAAMANPSRSQAHDIAALAAKSRQMIEALSSADSLDFELEAPPSPKRRRIVDPTTSNLDTEARSSISPSVGPNGTSTPRDSPVMFNCPGIPGISPKNQSQMLGSTTNPAAALVKRNLLDPFSFLNPQRNEPSQSSSGVTRHSSAPASTSNQNGTKRNTATVMFSHSKLEVTIPETRPPITHHPTHSVNVPYMLVAGQHSPYANRSATSASNATGCDTTWRENATTTLSDTRTDEPLPPSPPRNDPGSSPVTFQSTDPTMYDLDLNPGSDTSEDELLPGLDTEDSDSDY